MKTTLEIIIKSAVGVLGLFLFMASMFGGAIGVINGWGDPALLRRIGIGLAGLVAAVLGFFLTYWASDRNFETFLNRYILGWIGWFIR